mgnify:FL=1
MLSPNSREGILTDQPEFARKGNAMATFAGIDIAKHTFDLALEPQQKIHQFDNDAQGVGQCCRLLQKLEPELIVMEPTGGYETKLHIRLQEAGLRVAVVNARRIREFARADGKLAKTDEIDAQVMADFAARMRPRVQEPLDAHSRKLKALVARRHQLVQMRAAEVNRTEHATDPFVKQSVRAMIKMLDKQIDKLERQIQKLIETIPTLKDKAEKLRSVPAVGATTAALLVTELPELGQLNRKKIAALVGVAPINRDSGNYRGKRMTGGGRKDLRARLFMPTLCAIRSNPMIRDFYQRLCNKGKSKMTALIAAMRKLLTILNTMLKKKEAWNPKTA